MSGDLREAVARAGYEHMRQALNIGVAVEHTWERQSERLKNDWRGCADAILAEMRERGALVPDGWKVMPVEPTEEMEHVGGACVDHPSVYMSGPSRRGVRLAKQVYAAMLAAAPAPTTGEG